MAFTFTNSCLQGVHGDVCRRNAHEPEFLQVVGEVLRPLQPVAEQNQRLARSGVIDRTVEPERSLLFHISWMNDHGQVQANQGYRVQLSTTIGPSKGGLRFYPSVNLSIIKFLGFEQVFKNSLIGLPMGGDEGDTDFDPKGKSDNEVMRFCQSFTTRLQRHVGPSTDMFAGDVGVGARETGYLFGQYERIRNEFDGVLIGKDLGYGGSLARTEATSYGLCYFADGMPKAAGRSLRGQSAMISGSGSAAIYASQKATELGGRVAAISDSDDYIVGGNGINYKMIQEIKEVKRARIKTCLDCVPTVKYSEGCQDIRTVSCGIALPCATQSELPLEEAKTLMEHGCFAVTEGVSMPSTPEAVTWFQEHGVLFAPAKASNAGGMAVSGLETSQNSMRLSWSLEEVDQRLHAIIRDIYHDAANIAVEHSTEGNLVVGAGVADFMKVAGAMVWQGVSY